MDKAGNKRANNKTRKVAKPLYWCTKVAIQGGKTVQQDRQELGETDVQGARHPRGRQLLCRGRGPEGGTPSYAGAAGDVPEVLDRLPGEEEVHVPQVLLCLGSLSFGDLGTGV